MLLSLLLGLGSQIRSRTVRGLTYGPKAHQTIEVHAPIGADGEAPVVVVLRPPAVGAFRGRRFGRLLAARGLVIVAVAVAESEDALCDAAAACAWAHERAAAFGGDPRRLFVMGAAKTAGVAARLALEPRWLAEAGSARLRGVVGFKGLYDLGVEPAALARPDAPPLLLVAGCDRHSEADLGAGRLIGAVRSVGGQVAEIRCPAFDPPPLHRLLGALPLGLMALDQVERFIRLGSLEPVV
jgi:hypothetical protein